jgi:tRNA U34 2-thiouridine synthase MnmA/TrmU
VNWLGDDLGPGDSCEVQVRHRARAVPATVLESEGGGVSLSLAIPVSAITPGQSGVLYAADGQVLGGGVIA